MSFQDWQELDKYLSSQPLIPNLVSLANSKGVRYRPYLVRDAQKLLMTQLKANIIRNILGDEAFYPIILKEDIVMKKAIELLQQQKAYPQVVKSEGYK